MRKVGSLQGAGFLNCVYLGSSVVLDNTGKQKEMKT